MVLQTKDTFWATPAKWATLITSENIPGGKPYAERPVKNFDGVAVIDISGVILREEDEMCEYFGGASTLRISRQITQAVNDPLVTSILLYVNSPGGQVNGTAELADQIFNARAAKPVYAYVSGDCFSAGYWLASQAEKIIMHEAAGAGALGVCYPVSGEYSDWIISDSTPNKHPEVATAESRAQMQVFLNDLAQIFIRAVARGRGTNEQDVIANYGRGDIFIAAQAVAKGLADSVGSFESAIAIAKQGRQAETAETPEGQNPAPETAPGESEDTQESAQAIIDNKSKEVKMANEKWLAVKAGKVSAEMVDSTDITPEWLKQNMPDLVEQLIMEATDAEAMRQEELSAIEPAGEGEAAEIAAARKDRKITAAQLSHKLIMARQASAKAAEKAAIEARKADGDAVVIPAQVQAVTPAQKDPHTDKVLAALAKRRAK